MLRIYNQTKPKFILYFSIKSHGIELFICQQGINYSSLISSSVLKQVGRSSGWPMPETGRGQSTFLKISHIWCSSGEPRRLVARSPVLQFYATRVMSAMSASANLPTTIVLKYFHHNSFALLLLF